MTGFDSKRKIALDRLDDDDIQIYAQPTLKGESMTKDEAITLEALKYAASKGYGVAPFVAPFTIKRDEALAQPEQEPVAYCYVQKGTSVDILTFDDAPDDAVDGTIFPLYTTPPKQEPRNFCPRCGKRTPDLTTIHTCTPPRGLEMT